jgi:DNA-binding LacI/PurR family transcriptional regulator
MSGIPKRQSLVSQTAAYLREEIAKGGWNPWLPGERRLCESLQVSRNTLRAALEQLAAAGVIKAEHGLGNRVVSTSPVKHSSSAERVACLLSPDPLQTLRPTQTLWIDELRAMLIEHDCRLHVLHGQQYFRAQPAPALQRLVRQHPHACWILVRSTEPTQAWFQRSGHACVVAGSTSPHVDLAYVDLDHRALCRHAAGVLLGLGHRRIALIAERTQRAGDVASELGFIEGIRSSPHSDAEPIVVWHEPSVESVSTALRRLMEHRRPTALLVANPYFYLTITSRLAQLGWRIPEDVSVLSRDEDPFLSFLLPRPARYTIPAHIFARRLLRPVLEFIESGSVSTRSVSIMPQFLRGDSIAPLPAGTLRTRAGSRAEPPT